MKKERICKAVNSNDNRGHICRTEVEANSAIFEFIDWIIENQDADEEELHNRILNCISSLMQEYRVVNFSISKKSLQ